VRVLLATLEWSALGGLEVLTTQIALALSDLGHDVKVLAAHDHEPQLLAGIASQPMSPSPKLLRALARFSGWSEKALSREVRRRLGEFDLLIIAHANLVRSLAPLLALRKREWETCLWTYGRDVWGATGMKLAPFIPHIDHVVSISNFTASRLREDIGCSQIVVIPPCVDTDYFTPAAEEQVRLDEILICGRMDSADGYKGHDNLLRAIPLAEQLCGHPLKLRVVGEGENRPGIQALARSLGLGERITFTGRVSYSELRESYRRCGVFVLPTRVVQRAESVWSGDGFGIVYLEAASCGRPVLASQHGGAPETVVNGETGYTVDPLSPPSIANGIFRILSDPEHGQRLGQAGRRHVVKHFSRPVFVRSIEQLMKNVNQAARTSVPKLS
jgi:phosphatidylinositol alpha-1,6-mannosyltransferase